MSSLLYIADPMCSWCYGFGPELETLLRSAPNASVELVVGGLRAYNTRPMDAALRDSVRTHWNKVAAATGLPFCETGLDRPAFVYDTEPACRAVVAARRLAPQAGLTVFQAIQHAFYAEGKDVTQGSTLADVVVPVLAHEDKRITRNAFLGAWSGASAREETRADFRRVQGWGITGFPTLLLRRDDMLHLVTAGFARATDLRERLAAIDHDLP